MIEFILNNQRIKTSAHAGITLLDFIRDHQQLKGTKTGCREGDCGACTILVGTNNEGRVDYQTITSCISPLGNAHGKHIVTIEGINLPKELNTVQQAMADNYATQCGFCTPGFVVSMTGFALNSAGTEPAEYHRCNDAVSGNICRCTGYKSIEKAGFQVEKKLLEKNGNQQIEWLIREGFIPDYFATIPPRLTALKREQSNGSTVGSGHSYQPEKITNVANGTDLYVRHADRLADEAVRLLGHEKDLKGISFSNGICTLGANTTATEMQEHPQLQAIFPNLKKFLKLVSSEPIRNMGTLGGNFVNASPIGDMSVYFLALNATLTIGKADGTERTIPFQAFHKNYKEYDLQPGEILKSISFKSFSKNDYFNFEKVCKRTHLDIASVNAAGRITVENHQITDAHFSVGGTAPIPKYLAKTAAFLIGKTVDPKTVSEATEILQTEISPISDVRGTAEYKRLLAEKLFLAHFVELFPAEMKGY